MNEPRLSWGDQSYPLETLLLIGRSPICGIVIDETHVSRLHAAVFSTPVACYIQDLDSSNGILVNDVAVKAARLHDGDSVDIGNTTLTFHDRAISRLEGRPLVDTVISGGGSTAKGGDFLLDLVLDQDTARLLAEQPQRPHSPTERLLVLYKVANLITTCEDTETLLTQLVEISMHLLGADGGVLALAGPTGKLEARVQRSDQSANPREAQLKLTLLVGQQCHHQGVAILANHGEHIETALAATDAAFDLDRHMLCVPLRQGDTTIGVLSMDKSTGTTPFGPSDLKMLTAIANQTAVALNNRRLVSDLRKSLEQLNQHQTALVESEKLAAMGVLSAGVAHEVRNPLSIILGNIDLLLIRKDVPVEAIERIKAILRAAERIKTISEALLGFARHGKDGPQPFAPARAVEDALAMIEASGTVTKKFNTRVETKLEDKLHNVFGDHRWLSHALVNLVLNASQSMAADGGGSIVISARNRPGAVRLEVRDTGAGIAEGDHAHIFEPFSTTHRHSGTGLGLWVARRIVEDLGGTILVESTLGEGTAFIIELPAC